MRKLRSFYSKLEDQICRAGSSISLNLAEGNRRAGKDKQNHWRIAAGSADEVRTALRVAEAWGYLGDKDTRIPSNSQSPPRPLFLLSLALERFSHIARAIR